MTKKSDSIIRIVVDTNIVFSAFLNVNSRIAQILIRGRHYFEFYSPDYVKFELFKHKERIKVISGLSDNAFTEVYELIFRNINLINHALIPFEIYNLSEILCADIDLDDTVFVALSESLNARLWTGDIKLKTGLIKKDFRRIVSTEELFREFILKEQHRKKY